MIFRHPHTRNNTLTSLNLTINGEPIERVTSFDFLGVVFSETLSWKRHTEKIRNKISKVIGMMSRIKRYVDSSILLKIYNSLILSHLHYGILCWGFDCHSLLKLQKKGYSNNW